jgi:hypothetical protein
MPSSVDEQPPSRPARSRPQPSRRRPQPARARAAAPRQRVAPPPPPDGGDDEPRGGGRDRPGKGGSQRKVLVIMTVLSVLVAALAVFAVVNSRSSKKTPAAADTSTVDTPTTTYHDTLTGFTVQYPRSWQKINVPVADYRLAVDGGSNVAFTIRVVPIQTPADTSNLENFKAVTDGLVTSNSSVQILKQQAISLNGMIGYYYFYTFTDGGVAAVHAHYFLFSGNKMNVLVFQALPDDFARLAPTFDKVAESFKVDADTSSTTVTTAAPATTTTAG